MKILLFLLFLISSSLSQEVCEFSVTCDPNAKSCIQKEKTDSPFVFNLNLNTCYNSVFNYCNAYDVLISSSSSDSVGYCQKVPSIQPTYPGGKCKNDTECIYGLCYEGKCNNKNDNRECHSYEECEINETCFDNECVPYIENVQCRDSHECGFNKFCMNMFCIDAYSEDDYSNVTGKGEITDLIDKTDRPDLICKSGNYYKKDNRYYCGKLYNIDDTCRDECRYKNHLGEIITSKESCLCGYNKDRAKHCALGNGEKEYEEFLSMKKEFINNEEYTKYCHTLERDSDDICIELTKINRTVAFRKWAQKYNNAKILAVESARIRGSDDCVKNVLYGYNTNPIIPEKMSCPVVKCNENITSCFKGHNPLKEEGDDITIEMNSICKSYEVCKVLGSSSNLINTVFIAEETEGQCENRKFATYHRFPGEDCDSEHQCIEGSICLSSHKCSGREENESCSSNRDCLAGLYCSLTENKCLTQKKEGEKCETGWECVNYLGCYKGVCTKFGTVPSGSLITEKEAPFPGLQGRAYYFCESGQKDISGNYCTSTYYDGETEEKYIKGSDDFVKCNKDDLCYYRDSNGTFTKGCVCGYNEEGTGYCELPNSINTEKWKERIRYLAEMTNNNCHTLQRFICYQTHTVEAERKIREIQSQTTYAHYYHNGVQCAIDMFITSEYINISYVVLLLIFVLL